MKAIASSALRTGERLVPRTAPWLFPLLIFLHNPRRLLRPELWGDDGPHWYAQAYQYGIGSLLIPISGYLNTVQRLGAILVQPLPLAWTPFLFQLVSILIQAAPAIFLVSPRMDGAWPDRTSRYLFALLFLVMPNAPETSAGLTNSQWYLAILAFLLIVSSPPPSMAGRVVETLVLFLAGISGPFCVLLMPAVLWELYVADRAQRADVWRRATVLTVTCLIQGALILGISGERRADFPLGASFDLFVRIFSLISLGAEFGYRSVSDFFHLGLTSVSPLPYVAAFGSMALIVIAVVKGPRILAQYVIFAGGIFALSMAKPMISNPQWPPILLPPPGNRYFLFPMIAWWGALFVLAGLPQRGLRIAARVLLAITVFVAVPRDWGDPLYYPPTDFIARARSFDAAPPGTTMEFDIHPPPWTFSLTK